MSLRIRLSRGGAKKRPYYRIVVADSRRPRDGRYIERLGTYNPMVAKDHPERLTLKEERIKYWLSVGAQPTDRVARFCGDAGLMDKPPLPKQTKQNLPRPKTLERVKEAEEKKKAAKEAPAEETPTEEPATKKEAAEETPVAEEVAAAETPVEETPMEEPAAEVTAAEETAAAEEVPAEDTAAKETLAAEVTPAEDAAVEETPVGDKKDQ